MSRIPLIHFFGRSPGPGFLDVTACGKIIHPDKKMLVVKENRSAITCSSCATVQAMRDRKTADPNEGKP